MTDPNSPADRIFHQLDAIRSLAQLTTEEQANAREEREKRIAAILDGITPEQLEAAARARQEAVDEPFAVLVYRLAPGCYNAVLPTREEFARIQNRHHDAQQRLDELARLEAQFPDPLGHSPLTSYIEARRAEIKRDTEV